MGRAPVGRAVFVADGAHRDARTGRQAGHMGAVLLRVLRLPQLQVAVERVLVQSSVT